MKKIFGIGILIIFAILVSSIDVSAQYGKKKKRRTTDDDARDTDKTERVEVRTERGTPVALENLWFGINVGSPFIFNNVFSLSLGPMAAYKFNNFLSAGLIAEVDYTLFWRQRGPNENYFNLSAGAFARAKVFRALYAHVEGNYTSFDRIRTTERRTNIPVFLVGAGYSSPTFTAWGYEATLLYDVTGNLGEVTNRIPIVYRIAVTYNF